MGRGEVVYVVHGEVVSVGRGDSRLWVVVKSFVGRGGVVYVGRWSRLRGSTMSRLWVVVKWIVSVGRGEVVEKLFSWVVVM